MPYQPANRVDRVLDTAADAVELLDEIDAPLPPGEEVHIVDGPLRIQLAQALPGVVLVSRSAVRHLPAAALPQVPRVRAGARHLRELGRAAHAARRSAPTTSAGRPAPAASYLVDLYTLRSYRKAEFAREILAWASFIPAIDRVMYAPQVPFAASYFYTLEDPDPLRDNLAQFNNDCARRARRSTPSCAICSARRQSTF